MNCIGYTVHLILAVVLSTSLSSTIPSSRPVALSAEPRSNGFVILAGDTVLRIELDGRGPVVVCNLPPTRGGLTGLDITVGLVSANIYVLLADYEGSSAIGTCFPGKAEMGISRLSGKGTFSSIASTGHDLVVANSRTGLLLFLDEESLKPVRQQFISGAERISSIAYDPTQKSVVAVDGIRGNIFLISAPIQNGIISSGDVDSFLNTPVKGLQSVSVDRAHGIIYALTADGGLARIVSKGLQQVSWNFGTRPLAFAISSDGSVISVIDDERKLSIFDLNGGRLLFTFRLF
jgi:hypothetical protein